MVVRVPLRFAQVWSKRHIPQNVCKHPEPKKLEGVRRLRSRCANSPSFEADVTGFALALILIASVAHATWNLLAKKAGGGAVFGLRQSGKLPAQFPTLYNISSPNAQQGGSND